MEPNIGLTPSCLSKGQEEAITRRELVYEMRVDREQAKLKMKLIYLFFSKFEGKCISFDWKDVTNSATEQRFRYAPIRFHNSARANLLDS